MKKVLFTSHTANFQKFNHPFMQWFKSQGWEVHYASMGEEPVTHCDKHFTVSFSRSPFSADNIKAYKPLKKIIDTERYDIIHCHTPMGGVVTRLAARKARKTIGTKVIYTAHGFHFFKGAPLQNWLIYYPVEKYLAHYTDTIITINSEDYALAKRKMKANVVHVNGVGVNPSKIHRSLDSKSIAEYRKKLGLRESDFVMIYIAEISHRKRQQWLINTIASVLIDHKDMHLLLVGQDSLGGSCQQLAADVHVINQVHFLGYRKDISCLLEISDIALSSSGQEGLPVGVMESMLLGLPIVATDCRGVRDLVRDGIDGHLCSLNDTAAFNNHVLRLYERQNTINGTNLDHMSQFLHKNVIVEMANIYNSFGDISNTANDTQPIQQELPMPAFNLGAQAAFYNKLQGTKGSLKRIRRLVDEQTAPRKNSNDQ